MTAAPQIPSAPPTGWARRSVLDRAVLVEDGEAESSASGAAARSVVAAEPVAAIGGDGPVLSLVVALERQPPPDQPSIVPLIVSSNMSMDVCIGVDEEVLAALDDESADRHERLFADDIRYRFGSPVGIRHEPALAEATALGTTGRAALSASLDRETTLEVLRALRGSLSPLSVDAAVTYSRPAPARTLRLRSTWAEIWDAIAACADDGVVTAGTLRLATMDLLADGRLLVSDGDAEGPGTVDPDEAARAIALQAAVVLDRSDPNAWRLRGRPHPAVPFDHEQRSAGRVTRSLKLSAPLHRLLGEPLAGEPLDRFVSLVVIGPDGGQRPAAPRRLPRASRDDGGDGHQVLAWDGGALTSVATFAEPRRAANASAAFLATDAVRPALGSRPQLSHLLVDDVAWQIDQPEHLPVVEDGSASVWPDRIDPGRSWYAPQAELVLSDPGSEAARPFWFSFRRSGITGDARPALEATITLTLRRMKPDGADALAAGDDLQEVPVDGVAVALEVPFIDGNDGSAKHQVLEGAVTPTAAGWTVEIRVVNDWVRICYRALSGADPAAEPAVVRLDYSMTGYSPMRRGGWEVALRPSTAVLPVQFAVRTLAPVEPVEWKKPPEPVQSVPVEPVPVEPVFVAEALTLRTDVATVAMRREDRASALRPGKATVIAQRPVLVNRPVIRPVGAPIRADDVTHVKRTFARRVTLPARVPCAAHGGSYVEQTPTGAVAVGCRDELQLGETRYAVFRELADRSTPDYRMQQLLQQPGRFVAVPTRFGITRHTPAEGEIAYRPCVVLYAVLDPDDAANNRVQLDATLQPAIGAEQWAEAGAGLRELDPTPELLLPTEVEGVAATFTWALPGTEARATTTVLTGGLLRVGIACSIPDWLLLRAQLRAASLSGTAEFRYPDGTTFRSELMLDLTRVAGPWPSGPVEAVIAGDRATLTNRIERTVDVRELLCSAAEQRTRVPVAVSLPAAGTAEVAIPTGTVAAAPAVSLPRNDPVEIEESRSFVDSLETNVVFVNLVALAARGLARLTITARIQGLAEERTADVTDAEPTAELRFILSLTRYLTVRVLEYRITIIAADGAPTSGAWSTWDLADQGNVISLTWGHLGTASDHDGEGQSP